VFGTTVASLVNKELIKRHESPRSRRNFLNQLANVNNIPGAKKAAHSFAGPSSNQLENTFYAPEGSSMPMKIGTHMVKPTTTHKNFKSKKPTGNQRQQSADFAANLFNRTGPIKIPAQTQEL